jgi:Xaa-Pro aminopeptidase
MHRLNVRVPYGLAARKSLMDLPFPVSEYESRLKKCRDLMERKELSALVAFGDQNDFGPLTYLANFEPMVGRGAEVVTPDKVSLITDSAFHGEPMHSMIWKSWIEDVVITGFSVESFVSALHSNVSGLGGRIGLVGSYAFPSKALDLPTIDVGRDFLLLKSLKSKSEIEVMKECSRIAAAGMRTAVERTAKNVRENEVSATACKTMLEEGASRLTGALVVSGPRAGAKHDYPTRSKIQEGDMIYIDLGAIYQGYYSDMSRTVLVGQGTSKQRDALDSILEIYTRLLDRIRPGVSASRIAKEGEDLAKSLGWLPDYWSQGHGIGTSFLEIPLVSPASMDIFDAGMVFAFEPMITKLDLGTAVIEDDFPVTENGCQALTDYERKQW